MEEEKINGRDGVSPSQNKIRVADPGNPDAKPKT